MATPSDSAAIAATAKRDYAPHMHEYAQRMNRVLDYVDTNLGTPLELSALAQIAHFSPFHFHRMFATWMGETLGDYVRRRRLEQGAWLLFTQSDISVLQAAISVGFSSGEAFSRAFKVHFDATPSRWRDAENAKRSGIATKSNLDQSQSNFHQAFIRCKRDDSDSFSLMENLLVNVKIIDLASYRIAYLRHVGPYGESVGRFWGTFHKTRVAHGLTGNMFGIGHDDPAIAPPDKCRYDACVEIAENAEVKTPFSVARLPGGRCAVYEFRGDAKNIGAVWAAMLGQWLPGSGMQCAPRPMFEWYRDTDGMDEITGAFSCALCIPVEPLSR